MGKKKGNKSDFMTGPPKTDTKLTVQNKTKKTGPTKTGSRTGNVTKQDANLRMELLPPSPSTSPSGSGSNSGSSGGSYGGRRLDDNSSTFNVGGNQNVFTPASARLGGHWDSSVQFEPGPTQWDKGGTVASVTRSGGFGGGGGGGATNPTTGGEYSSVSKATQGADVSEVISGSRKGKRERRKRGTE